MSVQRPSIMLFGVAQRARESDLFKEELDKLLENEDARDMERIRKDAADCQIKAQEYNKMIADTKRKEAQKYNEEDLVMIKNFDTHVGICKKLVPKYKGPYKVAKVLRNDRYCIEDTDGFQQSRVPYKGVWAAANMKPWLGNTKGKVTEVRVQEHSSQDRPNCSRLSKL